MRLKIRRRLKNYSAWLGGFLTSKRTYRFLFVFVLIFAVVFTVSLLDRVVKVRKLEAIAGVDDVAVVLFVAALLAVAGAIYQDRDAIEETAQAFWNWITLDRRATIAYEAEEAVTSGVADYTDADWADAKGFLADKFDETMYPQQISVYYGMISPWMGVYDVVAHDGIVNVTHSLSTQEGELFYSNSYPYMTWSYNTMSYQENEGLNVFRLYVNGEQTYYWSNGQYLSVNYNCWYCQQVHSLASNNAQFSYYGQELKIKPQYVMVMDTTTQRVSPCVIYYLSGWKIRPAILGDCIPVWQVAGGTSSINAVYDPVIARDEDWDIVIDGHRYVDMVKDISQLVGLTVQDILDEKFKDIAAELEDLGVIDERLESWGYYVSQLTYLEKLEYLDSLTYTEEGALVVSATITNQFELDIPEVDFELPSLSIISTKFPFCIPFDLYYAISNLVAAPEPPVFDVDFPASIFYADADMSLDFSIFDDLAAVVRWTILLGFAITLIILTRKLIRG